MVALENLTQEYSSRLRQTEIKHQDGHFTKSIKQQEAIYKSKRRASWIRSCEHITTITQIVRNVFSGVDDR